MCRSRGACDGAGSDLQSVCLQVDVQEWILVVGGLGIVCGLALFSSNISRCLGVQVAKITFARGFSAEFGCAITVAIASRYGVCVACITVAFLTQSTYIYLFECICSGCLFKVKSGSRAAS